MNYNFNKKINSVNATLKAISIKTPKFFLRFESLKNCFILTDKR